ncbi:MAG: phospholipid carrier-dependent glycosyltransferase [Chloroflexi bacterium]|nr:phospholipid carrier-dependent glycosyltransferase [Chloroflexota bacterium]
MNAHRDVALPRWTRLDTLAVALVTVVAAALRLLSLNRPTGLIFDEIFYAQDACWYVAGSEAVCGISDLVSRAHPPLGKWLIGSGIAVFGYQPFGWRIAVAVAGIATVALLHVLAWRLLRRVMGGTALSVGATAASGLLALDFLHLVQSRTAMLDSLIVLFVVGAVTAIVLDRDRSPRQDARGWERAALGRPWRLAAGVCLGAATAVKWSGAYVAPAVIGLVVAWAILDRRRADPEAGWGTAIRRAFRREALPTALLLGLVPVLVYAASYAGRMPGTPVGLPWESGTVWRGIWDHQRAMLDFHTTLGGDHPYQSPPWSWPLLKRPVAFWFDAGGDYREILAMGNPVAWWPGLVALLAMGVTWARSGWNWLRPELVILAGAAATYLPWLVLSGDRSQTFIWYFLPTVPFLCLALGLVAALAWSRTAGRVALGLATGAVLGSFLLFVPLLTALPLTPDEWQTRMLFRDCERPGSPTLVLPDDTISEGPPPAGWCWI